MGSSINDWISIRFLTVVDVHDLTHALAITLDRCIRVLGQVSKHQIISNSGSKELLCRNSGHHNIEHDRLSRTEDSDQ
jgi:hypothetical protein